jgi:hypothetical protein
MFIRLYLSAVFTDVVFDYFLDERVLNFLVVGAHEFVDLVISVRSDNIIKID